jgi:hypothetical protein
MLRHTAAIPTFPKIKRSFPSGQAINCGIPPPSLFNGNTALTLPEQFLAIVRLV